MKLPDDFTKEQDGDERARMEVSTPGFKFSLDSEDGWKGVAMIIVVVLTIVAGVKLILDYL